MTRLYTLLYIWMLAGITSGWAQPVAFANYMAADGLSDNNALCSLRDRYGFVWIGTNNGLNCFDGAQNTVYRNMIEGKSGIENNTITALYEHGDDIWFGGSFGLYVYDRQANRFKDFDKQTKYGVSISAAVQDIVGCWNGSIWIGTQGQGLFIYNPTTGELTQDSRHGAFISDILAENDSSVFVATLQGHIILYSQDGNCLTEHHIPDYRSDKNNISLELIGSSLYIGCERGLYHIERGETEVNLGKTQVPGILLTAKTSTEAKVEGMQSGADVYLEKPFSVRQLQLQIVNLLKMRQTYHERMRNISHDANASAPGDGSLGLTRQDLLFMERLQKMVAGNMGDEDFSIDQLAGQMNMSRSSFYRKIKALTGMTPVDYLKMRRLEPAATLLRQGIRITEVAGRVGFTSSSYFAKCFKNRFGLLPKDFVSQ